MLSKEAVKIFKVIQRIMGDRDRSVGVCLPCDNYVLTVPPVHDGSTTLLPSSLVSVLEEARWLLAEGLTHGELRDEIYCQLMKQLSGNPNPSVFSTVMACVVDFTVCMQGERVSRDAAVLRATCDVPAVQEL